MLKKVNIYIKVVGIEACWTRRLPSGRGWLGLSEAGWNHSSEQYDQGKRTRPGTCFQEALTLMVPGFQRRRAVLDHVMR